MPFLGIALNDACITAVGEAGVVYAEPGCALLDGDGAVYGQAARASARTRPTAFHDRYWHEMSEKPLLSAAGELRTCADLAHGQLAELWARCGADIDAVAFAVPAGWGRDQLALMLGLAQEIGMPVAGLAEMAVAATRSPYPDQEVFSIEAGLHAIAVARLRDDEAAVDGETEVIADLGISRLNRAMAEYIARAFLETSRFDPLHDAASEQALYDRVGEWLERLRRQERTRITLTYRDTEYAAEIGRAALAEVIRAASQPLIQRLRAVVSVDRPTALQLSAELAAFPGLSDALEALPATVVYALEPGAAARGLFVRQRSLARSSGGFSLTTRLPLDRPPAVYSGAAPAAVNDALPTHVVHGHRAYRLGNVPLHIGAGVDAADYGIAIGREHAGVSRQHCTIERIDGRIRLSDHSRFGTELNGRAVQDSAVLQPGDVISFGRPPCRLTVLSEALPGEHDGPAA